MPWRVNFRKLSFNVIAYFSNEIYLNKIREVEVYFTHDCQFLSRLFFPSRHRTRVMHAHKCSLTFFQFFSRWKDFFVTNDDFVFPGSTGGSLSPVTSLALNSLTGTPLNGLQDSLSNAYSSLQQYAGNWSPQSIISPLFIDIKKKRSLELSRKIQFFVVKKKRKYQIISYVWSNDTIFNLDLRLKALIGKTTVTVEKKELHSE